MIAKQNIIEDYVLEPPSGKWWHYLAYAALLFVVIYISNIEVAFATTNNRSGSAAWVASAEHEVDNGRLGNWTDDVSDNVLPVIVSEPAYELQVFTISAYYSPIQGQNRYATGSYAGDIRLNGGGVRGADGTPVYPGMIAAPSNIAFGTKMHIPGVGTVSVHDRGGAIKGNRLDVWMGYGDKGLDRALKWGKRTLDVKVYGINPDIKEQIELDGYTENEKHQTAQSEGIENAVTAVKPSQMSVYANRLFSGQLQMGSSGQDVAKLQNILKDLKYYEGEITSVFDSATHEAVARFQISKSVVPSQNSYGAGYVGPVTSSLLASASIGMEKAHAMSSEISYSGIFSTDLKPGDSGENVTKLQIELQKVNLFGIEPTGYYGELTEHAIFKFQQIHKLAGEKTATGAGIFGPMTRSKMNDIVAARLKVEKMIMENS